MKNLITTLGEEKDRLTGALAGQYSQNIITMDEYERILEYINKIETLKEVSIIDKIIQENNNKNNEFPALIQNNNEKHFAVFSWRTTNVKPYNQNAGKYISLFGANRIIIDNLPKGNTIININSVFGLTEIIVSRNIKIINRITPLFSGVFAPAETNIEDAEAPELYITGKAIFGNVTIIRK
jgi:hypothetical protein